MSGAVGIGSSVQQGDEVGENLVGRQGEVARGFGDLNDTDLNSYQALVDVFQKEGVLQSPIAVRDKILKTTDFGS